MIIKYKLFELTKNEINKKYSDIIKEILYWFNFLEVEELYIDSYYNDYVFTSIVYKNKEYKLKYYGVINKIQNETNIYDLPYDYLKDIKKSLNIETIISASPDDKFNDYLNKYQGDIEFTSGMLLSHNYNILNSYETQKLLFLKYKNGFNVLFELILQFTAIILNDNLYSEYSKSLMSYMIQLKKNEFNI